MAKYKDVIVTAGSGGFGGPLHLHPNEKQNKIVNITGGVISPVAKRLAEMTGCELVDGFKTSVPDDEILAVVIDCGGTLRCGIYPQKRIQTINLNPTGPSGPLAQYIKPDIYVSAVREKDLAFAEGQEVPIDHAPAEEQAADTAAPGGVSGRHYDTSKKISEQQAGFMAKVGQFMGGIVAGVFTATEAAGVAALYTFILGKFLYKSLSWKGLVKATLDASVGTAVVMLMVGVSMTMSWLLASTGSAKMLADTIIAFSDNPYVLMMLFNVLLLLLGTFLDITPGLLIFTPIFLPVAMKLGISPVHFGIIITFNLCIGIATPPVGSTLFVAARVSQVSLSLLTRPLLPMFALQIIALFLVTYIPELSLWLPKLILGKAG